ncbi:MAG: aldehyde dehydrogenase family protein [Bdellovibrionota bacterium]
MNKKILFSARGNYINGKFFQPVDPAGEFLVKSPGDISDILGIFRYSYLSVDDAIGSARNGFNTWRKLTAHGRIEYLKKYRLVLINKERELAEAMARETGEPLWESSREVAAMASQIDIMIGEGTRFIDDFEAPSLLDGSKSMCRYRPLGVMAVIGSVGSPGYFSNWHIVSALLSGNTVVFKPSEKAPLVGQLIAESFCEAGFPKGVFNLVQGEKEVGRRLCSNEGIDGVLFSGSYEVGTRIKQDTLQQHWKLLVLEMGGKNPAVIWNDADLDNAVYETIIGAFMTAGQRCSSTSRVIVHKKILQRFLEKFHERSKTFSIGHPIDNPFMGPLIDQRAVDRYMKFIGIATREGCDVVMRGKALETRYKGYYVTPSICLAKNTSIEATKKSVYQQTELLIPNVAIIPVEDFNEAVAQANATQYGLVASVFCREREIFERFLENLQMGIVNWNKSTIEFSPSLPLGGIKKSGNYFPSGVMAMRYCMYPVSSIEATDPKPPTSALPGLNWK